MCLHCSNIYHFLYRASAMDQGKTVMKPRRKLTEIVKSPQPLHKNRVEPVRKLYGDGTLAVRSKCSFGHLCTKSVQLHISVCLVS